MLFVARVVSPTIGHFPVGASLEQRLLIAALNLAMDPMTLAWPIFVFMVFGVIRRWRRGREASSAAVACAPVLPTFARIATPPPSPHNGMAGPGNNRGGIGSAILAVILFVLSLPLLVIEFVFGLILTLIPWVILLIILAVVFGLVSSFFSVAPSLPGSTATTVPSTTRAQAPAARPTNGAPVRAGCDPAYPELRTCIPPGPPFNQGCAITNERNFTVLPPDPQGLDRDRDGIGCEPIVFN